MTVEFTETEIHFVGYQFVGATVHPNGVVTPSQLRDADWPPTTYPPELRTHQGETLFVRTDQAPQLQHFCERNDIPRRSRTPDIWGDLLDPFLDTTFGPDAEAATVARLVNAGLPRQEIEEIRQTLTPLMLAYNIESGLWDWTYLGLWDLLNAASGVLVPPDLPPTLGDPVEFYNWAMQLADLPTRTHP